MSRRRIHPQGPMPADLRTVPLHEQIATQARVLWEGYGQPTGRDVSIWLEAERQVLGVDDRVNQQAGGAIRADRLGETLHPSVSPPDGQPDPRGPVSPPR